MFLLTLVYFNNLVLGRVLTIEPTQTRGKLELSKIPSHIKYGTDVYKIAGVVEYCGLLSNVGHYKAVSFRNGKWIAYDDLKEKSEEMKSKSKILPALIIYIKI